MMGGIVTRNMQSKAIAKNKRNCCILLDLFHYVQGGSNMTGTDLCVNKPHMSRSYLNHLVHIQVEGFQQQLLRTIFGIKREELTRRWRNLHNEELHNLSYSPVFVR